MLKTLLKKLLTKNKAPRSNRVNLLVHSHMNLPKNKQTNGNSLVDVAHKSKVSQFREKLLAIKAQFLLYHNKAILSYLP